MELARLLAGLPDVIAVAGATNVQISDITADSRQVAPGALFVAYRGVGADGHRFIRDAVARGAAAVVGELPPGALPPADPSPEAWPAQPPAYIQVRDGRAGLAWLSASWHGQPSRDLALVGITGTDGKTTTANLLFSILRAAGRHSGLISTVSAVIGDQTYDTGLHTTTPDAPDVQRYLARMRDAGAEIAVLETTSIGLAQHRVTGCHFDVAVITNITHEHLDAHGTFAAYREAKALLFRSLAGGVRKPGLAKTAVLNRDDGSFGFLAAIPAERMITYGLTPTDTTTEMDSDAVLHLTAQNVTHTPSGAEFDVCLAPSETLPPGPVTPSPCHLVTPLVGDFNISNILAAMGAAVALGVGGPAIAEGVRAMRGVPGRMERIDRGQAFTAIVDFAHTPNALARALEALRGVVPPGGRLIVVFGSAGLRDREKRRMMGDVAARLADYTVITAEDPRTEKLASIMSETAGAMAAAGKSEGRDFVRIADRQRALLHAAQQARPGDVLVACGKGHEQSMCFGKIEHPWRDQEALAWALDAVRRVAPPQPPFVLPTWDAM